MQAWKRGQLWIQGAWVEPRQGGRLEVVNPADEQVLAEVAGATSEDVDRAVRAAVQAQPSWAAASGAERAAVLRSIAQAIREQASELAHLEVLDNGKPLPEADWDIADAAGCFDFYADQAERLDERQGETVVVGDDRFQSQVFYEPVGPSGLIIPWNYPLLMAAWKVAPALAAGCSCVLKPSELTPLTALELAEITRQVGLPPGVFNLITGLGGQAGAPLARHPELRKLAFTGSVPTGRGVMQAAAQDIKNISLELGGKSPILVFDDADLEAAVEWVLFGVFWNQGQVCSATSRLLVQKKLAPALVERLVAEARRISMGSGLEAGVKLGPLVSAQQRQKVHGFIERARARGAQCLCGGELPSGPGYFYPPTILTGLDDQEEAWREEIFGPVLVVSTFEEEAEALRRANDSTFGLAAAVLSADPQRCLRLARGLEAGIVWVNCSQPTFTEAPWGGMKQSGIGRELGQWGLMNYLEVKQVTTFRSSQPWGWYLEEA